MWKSRKKKGDVIVKMDLENVYDRVNWAFLKQTLRLFEFSEVL